MSTDGLQADEVTDAAAAPENAADQVNAADAPDAEPEGEDEGSGRADRQAARYRRQLRETEAERDSLRGQVERLQRAEVEHLAAAGLAQGGDLFEYGRHELSDFLDDDGNVDEDAVTAAVEQLKAARPGLAAPKPAPAAAYGAGRRGGLPTEESWADILGRGR